MGADEQHNRYVLPFSPFAKRPQNQKEYRTRKIDKHNEREPNLEVTFISTDDSDRIRTALRIILETNEN